MNLRHRGRGRSSSSDSLLPLTSADLDTLSNHGNGNGISSIDIVASPKSRSKRRIRKRKKRIIKIIRGIIFCSFILCCIIWVGLKILSNKNDKVRTIYNKKGKKIQYHTIICPDGSIGLKNDNYCDCTDGSDELNTSACSHILVNQHTFHCNDKQQTTIHASRVNDGINDCPNGTDEYDTIIKQKQKQQKWFNNNKKNNNKKR